MKKFDEDWDVILLTHPPIYPHRDGTGSCRKRWDRVDGLGKYVDALRFSASGLLKYYIEKGDTEQHMIPDYDRITLKFTATNGVEWTFKNGEYVSAIKKEAN